MRVVVLVPQLDRPGGVANYYRVLRDHLHPSIRYFARGSGSRERPRRGLSRVADYLRFVLLLTGSGRPDVVHVNTSFGREGILRDAIFVAIAKLFRCKVLVFFRGWNPGFEKRALSFRYRLFLRLFFQADRVLVLAAEFREKLQALGCSAEIGIETTVVDPLLADAVDASTIAARFERSTPSRTLLFLARVERNKGIYSVIAAHEALLARFPQLRLVIAGAGSELVAVQAYVRERGIGQVTFLGYVREEAKIDAFRRADLYLLPTVHGEGMPNALLEAMACGLPVITRRVGGIADFFVDREMGFLWTGEDAGELANLVERLLIDDALRRRIADHNRAYAAANFSAPRVAERLHGYYASLASNGL